MSILPDLFAILVQLIDRSAVVEPVGENQQGTGKSADDMDAVGVSDFLTPLNGVSDAGVG